MIDRLPITMTVSVAEAKVVRQGLGAVPHILPLHVANLMNVVRSVIITLGFYHCDSRVTIYFVVTVNLKS